MSIRTPKIKIAPTKNGFKVSGTINGKQRRKQFGGEDAAQRALITKQEWEREIAKIAPMPLVWTRLTDAQCREAEACYHRLCDLSLTLSQAVDFAVTNCQMAQNIGHTLEKATPAEVGAKMLALLGRREQTSGAANLTEALFNLMQFAARKGIRFGLAHAAARRRFGIEQRAVHAGLKPLFSPPPE